MGVGRGELGGGHGKQWIGGWALGSRGPGGLAALGIGYLSSYHSAATVAEGRLPLLLRWLWCGDVNICGTCPPSPL